MDPSQKGMYTISFLFNFFLRVMLPEWVIEKASNIPRVCLFIDQGPPSDQLTDESIILTCKLL